MQKDENNAEKVKQEITTFKKKLQELKQGYDYTIHEFAKKTLENIRIKQQLEKNRFNKKDIFSVSKEFTAPQPKEKNDQFTDYFFTNIFWGGSGSKYANQLATVTDRGFVYLFDTNSKKILFEKNFTKSAINTCAIELNENGLLAAAGYDGRIYVSSINSMATSNDKKENSDEGLKKFSGHQGVVSCVRFLNSMFMISASFDSVILLWDVNSQGKYVASYHDHSSEVSGLDVAESNGNIFATGSGDTTVKLWDIREKKSCVCTFKGSDSSVNCVKFLPGMLTTLAAGSEDSMIRLYDLRALKELATYQKDKDFKSINSIAFSKSGQILFASSSNSLTIHMWDLLDDGNAFATYEHKIANHKEAEATKGIRQIAINSAGDTIAFALDQKTVLIS